MVSKHVIQSIKTSVHTTMPGARILLFGSMVRNTPTENSDYDVLVITAKPLPVKEKLIHKSKIRKLLISALNAPVDLLLSNEEEVAVKKKLPENVIKWALEEGIEL